ncbi:MAG: hypothetical protein QF375_08310, partial [Arenicellales bacterium]|nr:hypothetical protein [Arenicellales bacterium]
VYPFAVSAGNARYPDTGPFIEFLRTRIDQILYIDAALELPATLRSLYALGQASTLEGFPVPASHLSAAIVRAARPERRAHHVETFERGCSANTL